MIQGVISRMSGFSATAKNFAVTVSVALVALAFDKGAHLLWTGVGALVAFIAMDFYYHLLEVRFRELYQSTARSPLNHPSDMLLNVPEATAAHVKKVLASRTLLPFYVLLLFAFLLALYEAAHVPAAKLEPNAATARHIASDAGNLPAPKERTGGAIWTANRTHAERARGLAKQPAQAGHH